METLIRISGLDVSYPDREAPGKKRMVLQGISLEIKTGETLGLVGESGCGKTTLGRSILGLIPIAGGSIQLAGPNGPVELTGLSEKEFRPLRKNLQIIFQDPFSSLNPRLRVLDLLMEGVRIHFPNESGEQRLDRCVRALGKVGLGKEILDRFPHEFSGGQRQRIGIARAIVLEPEFIVCDESVSALDVSVQAQIINLLMDLQESDGLTLLFISHDLSVVKHISHRIAVMDGGTIVELDETERVIHSPVSPVTKKLLQAIPTLGRRT